MSQIAILLALHQYKMRSYNFKILLHIKSSQLYSTKTNQHRPIPRDSKLDGQNKTIEGVGSEATPESNHNTKKVPDTRSTNNGTPRSV